MTVAELFDKCSVQSQMKVMSAYNGKVLCHRFNPEKHKDIGERAVYAVWADVNVVKSGFGGYVVPIMCVYANGLKELEEATHEK